MGRLTIHNAPAFRRDVKRLKAQHQDLQPLVEVVDLIAENSEASRECLKRRHRAHALLGQWKGSNECHVANAGDWLLIWRVHEDIALMVRTGTHDQLFKN